MRGHLSTSRALLALTTASLAACASERALLTDADDGLAAIATATPDVEALVRRSAGAESGAVALAFARRAVSLAPEDPRAQVGLARALARSGDRAGAARVLEEASAGLQEDLAAGRSKDAAREALEIVRAERRGLVAGLGREALEAGRWFEVARWRADVDCAAEVRHALDEGLERGRLAGGDGPGVCAEGAKTEAGRRFCALLERLSGVEFGAPGDLDAVGRIAAEAAGGDGAALARWVAAAAEAGPDGLTTGGTALHAGAVALARGLGAARGPEVAEAFAAAAGAAVVLGDLTGAEALGREAVTRAAEGARAGLAARLVVAAGARGARGGGLARAAVKAGFDAVSDAATGELAALAGLAARVGASEPGWLTEALGAADRSPARRAAMIRGLRAVAAWEALAAWLEADPEPALEASMRVALAEALVRTSRAPAALAVIGSDAGALAGLSEADRLRLAWVRRTVGRPLGEAGDGLPGRWVAAGDAAARRALLDEGGASAEALWALAEVLRADGEQEAARSAAERAWRGMDGEGRLVARAGLASWLASDGLTEARAAAFTGHLRALADEPSLPLLAALVIEARVLPRVAGPARAAGARAGLDWPVWRALARAGLAPHVGAATGLADSVAEVGARDVEALLADLHRRPPPGGVTPWALGLVERLWGLNREDGANAALGHLQPTTLRGGEQLLRGLTIASRRGEHATTDALLAEALRRARLEAAEEARASDAPERLPGSAAPRRPTRGGQEVRPHALEIATRALGRGEPTLALELIATVLKPSAPLDELRVRALARAGRRDEAREAALGLEAARAERRGVGADPARVLTEEGLLGAAAELVAARPSTPGRSDPTGLMTLLDLARRQEDREAAAQLTAPLMALLTASPNAVDNATLEQVLRALAEAGLHPLADQLLAAARAARPRDPTLARLAIARAARLGRREEVEAQLKAALDEGRVAPSQLLGLALDLRQTRFGLLPDALVASAVARFPSDPGLSALLARHHLDSGRPADAAKAVTRALTAAMLDASTTTGGERLQQELSALFAGHGQQGALADALTAAAPPSPVPRAALLGATLAARVAAGQLTASRELSERVALVAPPLLPSVAVTWHAGGYPEAGLQYGLRALWQSSDPEPGLGARRAADALLAAGRPDGLVELEDGWLGAVGQAPTPDQALLLAELALAGGAPAVAEALVARLPVSDARAAGLLRVAGIHLARGDDAQALDAATEAVAGCAAGGASASRGPALCASALRGAVAALTLASHPGHPVLPALVSAAAELTPADPWAVAALRLLVRTRAEPGATPELGPVTRAPPPAWRQRPELTPLLVELAEALAAARPEAATTLALWAIDGTADRDMRLLALRMALRSGHLEVVIHLARTLAGGDPAGSTPLAVEALAAGGLPRLARRLARATLPLVPATPAVARSVGLLAAAEGPEAEPLTLPVLGEDRVESRLLSLEAAMARGDHRAVRAGLGPLLAYPHREPRLSDAIVRAVGVEPGEDERASADPGTPRALPPSARRLVEVTAERPSATGAGLLDVAARAMRADLPGLGLALLAPLRPAGRHEAPLRRVAVEAALAAGETRVLDAWLDPATPLDPAERAWLVERLAASGELERARALAEASDALPADVAPPWASRRVALALALGARDYEAAARLATSPTADDAALGALPARETLRSLAAALDPRAARAALPLLERLSPRGVSTEAPDVIEAAMTALTLADGPDAPARVAALLEGYVARFPLRPLGPHPLGAMLCRALAAPADGTSPWLPALEAALTSVARAPDPARREVLEVLLALPLRRSGDRCEALPLALRPDGGPAAEALVTRLAPLLARLPSAPEQPSWTEALAWTLGVARTPEPSRPLPPHHPAAALRHAQASLLTAPAAARASAQAALARPWTLPPGETSTRHHRALAHLTLARLDAADGERERALAHLEAARAEAPESSTLLRALVQATFAALHEGAPSGRHLRAARALEPGLLLAGGRP